MSAIRSDGKVKRHSWNRVSAGSSSSLTRSLRRPLSSEHVAMQSRTPCTQVLRNRGSNGESRGIAAEQAKEQQRRWTSDSELRCSSVYSSIRLSRVPTPAQATISHLPTRRVPALCQRSLIDSYFFLGFPRTKLLSRILARVCHAPRTELLAGQPGSLPLTSVFNRIKQRGKITTD